MYGQINRTFPGNPDNPLALKQRQPLSDDDRLVGGGVPVGELGVDAPGQTE